MSHNKTTIGTATPDATGAIAVALNDLSDVNVSPSENEYLVYSSGSWSATTPTTVTTAEHIWLGEGASQTYPEGWVATNHVYFYAASPVNQISGASLASSDSFANWYDEISIPSGTYLAQARAEGDFTSSAGVFRYRFTTEISGTTTTHAASGVSADLANTNQNPAQAQALINIASAATLRVEIISAGSSNLATTGMTTNQGLYGYLWLMKVG